MKRRLYDGPEPVARRRVIAIYSALARDSNKNSWITLANICFVSLHVQAKYVANSSSSLAR